MEIEFRSRWGFDRTTLKPREAHVKYIVLILVVILSATFCLTTGNCYAAEAEVEKTTSLSKSIGIGVGVGLAIGGAAILITGDDSRSLEYLAAGAGLGALGGAAYYGYIAPKMGDSLAEIDNGKVKISLPSIKVTYMREKLEGSVEVIRSVALLRIKF